MYDMWAATAATRIVNMWTHDVAAHPVVLLKDEFMTDMFVTGAHHVQIANVIFPVFD